MEKKFNLSDFLKIFGIVAIWFAISELPRYFLCVRPAMMEYLSAIPNMGSFEIFEACMWTILSCVMIFSYVFIYWLCAIAFGNNKKAIFISSTLTWLAMFVFYWLASATMLTAEWKNLVVALPLAYLETLISSYLCYRFYSKKGL